MSQKFSTDTYFYETLCLKINWNLERVPLIFVPSVTFLMLGKNTEKVVKLENMFMICKLYENLR